MAVSPYIIPVETGIDVEEGTVSDLQSVFVNNNNGKELEGVTVDEDIAPKRKMTIEESLGPLLASMKLFGLYCSRPAHEVGNDGNKKSRKWKATTIYGAAVVTLLWINAVRMLSVFTREDKLGVVLVGKLIVTTWSIHCATAQTAFYWASVSGRLAVVFSQPLTDSCARHARKFSITYSLVAWSIIMLASAFFAYGSFFTDGL